MLEHDDLKLIEDKNLEELRNDVQSYLNEIICEQNKRKKKEMENLIRKLDNLKKQVLEHQNEKKELRTNMNQGRFGTTSEENNEDYSYDRIFNTYSNNISRDDLREIKEDEKKYRITETQRKKGPAHLFMKKKQEEKMRRQLNTPPKEYRETTKMFDVDKREIFVGDMVTVLTDSKPRDPFYGIKEAKVTGARFKRIYIKSIDGQKLKSYRIAKNLKCKQS